MRGLRGLLFCGLDKVVQPQKMAMSKATVIHTVDQDVVDKKGLMAKGG
jgi:hypothetical protein